MSEAIGLVMVSHDGKEWFGPRVYLSPQGKHHKVASEALASTSMDSYAVLWEQVRPLTDKEVTALVELAKKPVLEPFEQEPLSPELEALHRLENRIDHLCSRIKHLESMTLPVTRRWV